MTALYNFGISIDKGVIPPSANKQIHFNLFDAVISIEKGVIPPKNYFKSQLFGFGVSIEKASDAVMWYQII